jgi:hypothetical protein
MLMLTKSTYDLVPVKSFKAVWKFPECLANETNSRVPILHADQNLKFADLYVGSNTCEATHFTQSSRITL